MKYYFPHSLWIKIENHLINWEKKTSPSGESFDILLSDGTYIEPEEMLCKN